MSIFLTDLTLCHVNTSYVLLDTRPKLRADKMITHLSTMCKHIYYIKKKKFEETVKIRYFEPFSAGLADGFSALMSPLRNAIAWVGHPLTQASQWIHLLWSMTARDSLMEIAC